MTSSTSTVNQHNSSSCNSILLVLAWMKSKVVNTQLHRKRMICFVCLFAFFALVCVPIGNKYTFRRVKIICLRERIMWLLCQVYGTLFNVNRMKVPISLVFFYLINFFLADKLSSSLFDIFKSMWNIWRRKMWVNSHQKRKLCNVRTNESGALYSFIMMRTEFVYVFFFSSFFFFGLLKGVHMVTKIHSANYYAGANTIQIKCVTYAFMCHTFVFFLLSLRSNQIQQQFRSKLYYAFNFGIWNWQT